MSGQIATADILQLEALEKVINRGWKAFNEVGLALQEVRDRRLYKARGFKTFEAYCQETWQVGASRVRQMIAAAKVAARLESVTNVAVQNEAQARALNRLPESQQAQALTDAAATGRVTAERLNELARKALAGLPPREQVEVTREEEEDMEREAHQERGTVRRPREKGPICPTCGRPMP